MCPWRSQQKAGNQWVTSEIFGKGSWNIRKSSWGCFHNLVVWCCFWALVLAWILVGQNMWMRFWLALKREYRFQCNQLLICTFERQLIQLHGFFIPEYLWGPILQVDVPQNFRELLWNHFAMLILLLFIAICGGSWYFVSHLGEFTQVDFPPTHRRLETSFPNF